MSKNLQLSIQEVPPAEAPFDLLLIADPSLEKLNSYLPSSRCFVAFDDREPAGVYSIIETAPGAYELMNIAVAPSHQKNGLGSMLLQHAIATVGATGALSLEVGTGTFGYQLAFYQRNGFRVTSIDRDFFLRFYPEPVYEDGIQHKDMLRLALYFPRDAGTEA